MHALLLWQLWHPHQARLRQILMGYTLRQSCTKEIIDEAENSKCTTCVFCCFFLANRIVQEQCCVIALEDKKCTTGINMAKDQGVCHSLLANTCEDKTKKVCVRLTDRKQWNKMKITVYEITACKRNPPPPSKCTTLDFSRQPVEANDWWEWWCISVCVCAVSKMRHVTLGRTWACCCQLYYKFSSDCRIFCRLTSKLLKAFLCFYSLKSTVSVAHCLISRHTAHQHTLKKKGGDASCCGVTRNEN